ncbi:hypothetical protein NAEX_04521 [Nannocystis exedens]|nr:hypothetical protein NAEX_04521 [Nannocystis exedens]
MATGAAACDSERTTRAGRPTLTTTKLMTLLGALALVSGACGPEPATTATTPSETNTGSDTTTTAPTTTAPTTEPGTTTTAPGTTTTEPGTTTSDTTTGGECVAFETFEPPDEDVLPVQFTCGQDAVVCPSNGPAGLFTFEGAPEREDAAGTEDLSRVHCLLEALRDRTPGLVTYELSWPVLGTDRGALEIAGEFVISRREVLNDFNYEYREAALLLEPPQLFADCRAQNTASAAWACLRPYILVDSQQLECVTAPLVCA